ncbi:tetratricopeptide repeat protein [Bordetella sp. FB-8]|uniref:tetratricopeptide repeat-containing glycosyltransferase family protein n=1 Tax=Bordetella sp. FB-8 TaxID=1159870 RepID=UPI000378D327|nr:tetratricopeptide repeat-containing glycosyltransferase family protein [Bordetella sp. FB-8]
MKDGDTLATAGQRQADDAAALVNHGVQLTGQQRLGEALASFEQAIALDPELVEALRNRGTVLYRLGRFEEAVASYDRALALKPDVEVYRNRGVALYDLRRLDEAVASYDRALALKPDYAPVHLGRAMALLRAGDLPRGFEIFRWYFQLYGKRKELAAITCPDWGGEPLAGKRLVVFADDGYGDSLQFVRYVPMAAACGAHVTLLVPSPLLRLLRASLPGIEVVDRLLETAVFDFQTPMRSLPGLFGTTLKTIPARTPYLLADPIAAAAWSRRLAALPGYKVGLVWAGAPGRPFDARRSLRPAQLAPLAAVPGVQRVSLQIDESPGKAQASLDRLQLVDWTDEIRDFADTAALIAGLDLVITVDTAVAHLAGALGRPVWILSRYDGCWRWLLNRQDSPWYPTARLFHQPAMGAWEPVITEVVAALKAASSNEAPQTISGERQTKHMENDQAELQAILASYAEAPALTAAQLEGSTWKFFDLNARLLSSAMSLAAQGLLQNPGTADADRWQMINGQLCLAAANGAPAVIFKLARMDETGRIISFAGQGVVDAVQGFYFLRAV